MQLKGWSAEEYRDFLDRWNLRQVDGAWLCNQTARTGRYWAQVGVPVPCTLLLKAFDDRLIPLEWFAKNVTVPIPE